MLVSLLPRLAFLFAILVTPLLGVRPAPAFAEEHHAPNGYWEHLLERQAQ